MHKDINFGCIYLTVNVLALDHQYTFSLFWRLILSDHLPRNTPRESRGRLQARIWTWKKQFSNTRIQTVNQIKINTKVQNNTQSRSSSKDDMSYSLTRL